MFVGRPSYSIDSNKNLTAELRAVDRKVGDGRRMGEVERDHDGVVGDRQARTKRDTNM
jgi:hypothetical protein